MNKIVPSLFLIAVFGVQPGLTQNQYESVLDCKGTKHSGSLQSGVFTTKFGVKLGVKKEGTVLVRIDGHRIGNGAFYFQKQVGSVSLYETLQAKQNGRSGPQDYLLAFNFANGHFAFDKAGKPNDSLQKPVRIVGRCQSL